MRTRSLILLCSLLFCSLFFSATTLATDLRERLRLAVENYEQVITEQLANDDERTYQDWLVLAQAYLSAGNKDAALEALQQANGLATTKQQQAHVALFNAKVYGILFRDTRHAISYLQQADDALRNGTSIVEQELYSEVLTNFAQAHNQLGDLNQAEQFAAQSLALAITLESPAKQLAARIMLGRLALQNNHFERANNQLQQALILADNLKDTEARASIHFRLGMAFRKVDDHALALEHMQQAAELYQGLKNLSSYSYVLVYIAETYLEEPQNITKAEQYLLEALAISKQIDDVMRTAIIKQSLGRASKLRGENSQAAQYYRDALQQFRQIGAQTYMQESALALAELLLLQQQYPLSRQIIAELSPAIGSAANYLQARYFSLSAELAVQQQDWQQAYLYIQDASKMQYAELTSTTTEKLKVFKANLTDSNTQHANTALALSQQSSLRQHLLWWQAISGLLMLLLILIYGYRRQKNKRLPANMAILLSPGWNRFCERLHQDTRRKLPLQFIAITLEKCQQLKLNHGEEALRRPLQELVKNCASPQLSACCINSDVIWLGYRSSAEDAAEHCHNLREALQQALTSLGSADRLISLQLDAEHLLGARWQVHELTTLREAFWLCWKLADIAEDSATSSWQMQLTSEQSRPCEWHSSNIRLDMINAFQLGTLVLTLNQQLLPSDLARALVADFTDMAQ
jgi:tetratricopeptide (TPR) repeat protein